MNDELKKLIKLSVDAVVAAKAVLSKEDFVLAIVPKLYAIASDIPGVAAGFGDLSAEIEALKTQPAEADLIAYVVASVAGVTSDEHASKILSSILILVGHVVQDAIALEAAIKA